MVRLNTYLSPPTVQPIQRVKGMRTDPQKYGVEVKASAIDGQGAFAAEPVPARRKIGEIRGEARFVVRRSA